MPTRRPSPHAALAAVPAAPGRMRQEILAAAARLFRQQGYAGTTLRQIAEAAGIKAGSIYYHFESKDEIAARVLDAGIDAVAALVAERLASLAPGAGSRERLGMAIEGHLRGMLHHGDFTSAHIRIYRHVSEAARTRHHAVRSAYTRLWDGLLADAAAAGVVRADVPLPMIRQYLVGALNWPVDWYDPRRGSFEAFAAHMTSLVLDGIAAPEAA
ncbi:MAG TPA: TetR/AcrR family transcriptional regulator [Solirubrobacteraceae bacterium]|nr:TetR/AcrR family transcriptional regulator [Solirubrobacteraceae bacterium]